MEELSNFGDFIKVDESGYSSLANTLRGLRPSIHTIGIITAWNPYGIKASNEKNYAANERLSRELVELGLGFRLVKGKYGVEEDSFIISNISTETLQQLGYKYEQDSVIFGDKIENKRDSNVLSTSARQALKLKNQTGMEFLMISTNPRKPKEIGTIIGTQRLFVKRENAEDFYSEYKGRRFVIPFFGVEDTIDSTDDFEKVEYQEFSKGWKGGETPSEKSIKYRNRKTGNTISREEYEEAKNLIKESVSCYGYRAWGLRTKARRILNK